MNQSMKAAVTVTTDRPDRINSIFARIARGPNRGSIGLGMNT